MAQEEEEEEEGKSKQKKKKNPSGAEAERSRAEPSRSPRTAVRSGPELRPRGVNAEDPVTDGPKQTW